MASGLDNLTKREREVLRLLVRGHDAKSVATALDLSVHTVNERLREARQKLGVSSSREAARMLAASEGADASHKNSVAEEMGVVAASRAVQTSIERARNRSALVLMLIGGLMLITLAIAFVSLSPASDERPKAAILLAPRPRAQLSALFTPSDYPPAARGENAVGNVGVRLELSEIGRVVKCDIERSSGSAELDAATCRILKSRSRFNAAIGPEGRAVSATYRGAVDWPRPGNETVRVSEVICKGAGKNHREPVERKGDRCRSGDYFLNAPER